MTGSDEKRLKNTKSNHANAVQSKEVEEARKRNQNAAEAAETEIKTTKEKQNAEKTDQADKGRFHRSMFIATQISLIRLIFVLLFHRKNLGIDIHAVPDIADANIFIGGMLVIVMVGDGYDHNRRLHNLLKMKERQ